MPAWRCGPRTGRSRSPSGVTVLTPAPQGEATVLAARPSPVRRRRRSSFARRRRRLRTANPRRACPVGCNRGRLPRPRLPLPARTASRSTPERQWPILVLAVGGYLVFATQPAPPPAPVHDLKADSEMRRPKRGRAAAGGGGGGLAEGDSRRPGQGRRRGQSQGGCRGPSQGGGRSQAKAEAEARQKAADAYAEQQLPGLEAAGMQKAEAEFKQAAEAEARQKAEAEARHKVEAEAWLKSEAEAMKKAAAEAKQKAEADAAAQTGRGGCRDGAPARAARPPAHPGGVDVARLRHAWHRRCFRAALTRDDPGLAARAQSAGNRLPDRRPTRGVAQGSGACRCKVSCGGKGCGAQKWASRDGQNRGNLRCARTPLRASLRAFRRSPLDKDGRGHASAGPAPAFVFGDVIGCARPGAPGARRMPARLDVGGLAKAQRTLQRYAKSSLGRIRQTFCRGRWPRPSRP